MRRYLTIIARILLIIILIAITALAFGQSQKKIQKETLFFKTYVKTATPSVHIDCRELYVEYFFNKRRFIFRSDIFEADLKVIKRDKYFYLAKNKYGVVYKIQPIQKGNEIGWLVTPNENSVGAVIIRINPCD
jgi:hypothetical protein